MRYVRNTFCFINFFKEITNVGSLLTNLKQVLHQIKYRQIKLINIYIFNSRTELKNYKNSDLLPRNYIKILLNEVLLFPRSIIYKLFYFRNNLLWRKLLNLLLENT